MFPSTFGLAALLSIAVLAAAAPPISQNPDQLAAASILRNFTESALGFTSRLNTTIAGSEPLPLRNLSSSDVPSRNGEVDIKCSYTHELELDACLSALSSFVYPLPDRPLTIGQRIPGRPGVWDLELPIRWMSGE